MFRNLLAIAILLASTQGFAFGKPGKKPGGGQNYLTLTLMQRESSAGERTIPLNQQARGQLQRLGLNPADYVLEGVTLSASSLLGLARATLLVGHDQDIRGIGTQDRPIVWDLGRDPGQINERWQLRLLGNVRISYLQVHLRAHVQTQRVHIPLFGKFFSPQTESTIFLRQELERMGVRTQGRELVSILFLAKSQIGRGQATLQVGPSQQTRGVPAAAWGYSFEDEHPGGYNHIPFQNFGSSQGVWQLQLNGRIKVQAVIVELR